MQMTIPTHGLYVPCATYRGVHSRGCLVARAPSLPIRMEHVLLLRSIAHFVLFTPILAGTSAWILSLSSLTRFAVGFFLGLLVSLLLHLFYLYRSDLRRTTAINIAQLSPSDLHPLFPDFVTSCSLYRKSDYEKVNWLNRELEEIWPFLNEAASGLLKSILQSVLDPYKFSVIQKIIVKSVTLGTVSPLFDGVKLSGGDKGGIALEAKFDWRHGRDAKIVIQLYTTGPLLTVQIKDFVMFGIVKLIFKPLKEHIPGFGAVTLSLLKPPIVDFKTKFLGGNILDIPGVENVVDSIIITALTDILVWPNRLVIPIVPGDYSDLMLKTVGHLHVQLVEAQDISKADIWGESDPYVVLYIRRKQGCMYTSSTKMNTASPVWNESFLLNVEDLESQKLNIQVFDYDSFKPHDFIGIGELPLYKLKPDTEEEVWIDIKKNLKNPELKSEGKVHLCLLYKPLPE